MEHFLLFVLVGFVAQLIDGILGMAYGVSATSFLLSLGIAPAVASASVHAAEVVTTGFSGLAHLRFGNVDRTIVRRLLIPGVIGAVVGAYVLISIPGDALKPWIAGYLFLMGVVILSKAVTFKKSVGEEKHHHLVPLGFAGGFLDAIGGGGWGPIVTGTLVARGNSPRFTIGSVNMAEFFVTAAASATFIATIGLSYWEAIAGLALGGAVAAPIAAWATSRVPARPLLVLVGLTVVALSARTIWLALR
ncbi:MAG TPA: sulfite exporter TauE/SafE family protein [Thermoanaerobaculia bacterium]|nr:sulfite exporter TauE/SafE family protein [Thermoanaerobaculia bacterium]